MESEDRPWPRHPILAYFLTFTTYGTWRHGDDRGSVQRGSPGLLAACAELRTFERDEMDQPPYVMDALQAGKSFCTLRDVADYRGWSLLAAHVRSNHLHAVVHANTTPERVMNDFKAYLSRRLNEARLDTPDRKRWTRHGSTQYLWSDAEVIACIRYTVHEQGEPMAVFVAESYAEVSAPHRPDREGGRG
ncbi:MAG: transposase [Gemmataceae bacterium]